MIAAADLPVTPLAEESSASQVGGIVQQVVRTLKGAQRFIERRRAPRHAYPYPIRMWPVRPGYVLGGTLETVGSGWTVVGKHLSAGGLDFYSHEPIAERKVIIRLECGDTEPVELLTELTWCRFGHHGLYVNGGRFLRTLPSHRVGTAD